MLAQEMNAFLRSRKILSMEQHLTQDAQKAFWCFAIKYADDIHLAEQQQQRTDYRKVLDEATFKKFATLREIRKRLATEENTPAYVIFTDEELAKLAQLEPLTLEAMKSLKGVGEKKIEKYGRYFIPGPNAEKS